MTRLFGTVSLVAMLLCHAVPARASAIQLTDASQLSTGGSVVTFPGLLSDPFAFDLTGGSVTLTFSTLGLFTVLDSDGVSFDFPANTTLLVNNLQSGPLTISFSTGVREVGVFAQSLALDTEAFTFDLFHNGSTLGTFETGPADNSGLPGVALFIGARATGSDLITQLTINEFFNNDFVIGPVTVGEAIAAEPVTLEDILSAHGDARVDDRQAIRPLEDGDVAPGSLDQVQAGRKLNGLDGDLHHRRTQPGDQRRRVGVVRRLVAARMTRREQGRRSADSRLHPFASVHR